MLVGRRLSLIKQWYAPRQLNAKLLPRRLDCPTCASQVEIPKLNLGNAVHCPCCDYKLAQVDRDPYATPIALALTGLIILLITTTALFITINIGGANYSLNLPQMMGFLFNIDFGSLAYLLFLFVFATPLVFLLLCTYVYLAFVRRQEFPFLTQAVNWLLQLRHWLMLDIFFVSVLVALVKIRVISEVSYGVAFFSLFCYSLLLLRLTLSISSHWVYDQLAQIKFGSAYTELMVRSSGESCRRCFFYQDCTATNCEVCGNKLKFRAYSNLRNAWAFLIAAMLLYFPANLLPMMISSNPTVIQSNKILDGIFYLWSTGDHFVAVIIFCASIMLPIIKIILLLIFFLGVQYRPILKPLVTTKLYLLIEKIGRWSMIDVFVIITLMSVFRDSWARVVPGAATIYFTLVIILTMLATHCFDTRLVWGKTKGLEKLTDE